MRKSDIFFFLLTSFILGVGLKEVAGLLVAGCFLILGIILITAWWGYWRVVFVGFCLIILVFGLYRANFGDWQWGRISFLEQFAKSANSVIEKILPYPQSAFLSALLLGQRQNLPQETLEKFNCTGTRHIVALSGYHTAVVVSLLMGLFLFLGFWRGQAIYLTLIGIALFVLLTGARASTVRAGIMAGSLLVGQLCGRLTKKRNILALTAFLMLIKDPSLLINSVAFQLSFAAVVGIAYLSPLFKEKLKFLPEAVSISLSAQLAIAPFIFYYFRQLSLIAPLANLLVLPLLPFIILIGFAVTFLSALHSGLGLFFAWPIWFLLSYVIEIVKLLAKIPGACLRF